MKRIAFCFDGSWNRLNAAHPTNVVLVAESILPTASDGTAQIVYYDEGVGTASDDKLRGGAFGQGLMTNVREAYRFLVFNYEPGDEIYAFGFSRGAFTARSFVGFIQSAGIIDVNDAAMIDEAIGLYRSVAEKGPHSEEARRFRQRFAGRVCLNEEEESWRCSIDREYAVGTAHRLHIRYVGVWDTVAALGWPRVIPGSARLNSEHHFHNANLSENVEAARHAVAIDEKRILFAPTLWTNVTALNAAKGFSDSDPKAPYQQKWFPGIHGSVGGGGPERGLSDDALAWVMAGAKKMGLQVNVNHTSRIYEIRPNFKAPLSNDPAWNPWHGRGPVGWLKGVLLTADREGPTELHELSASARRRWSMKATELPEKKLYRPSALRRITKLLDGSAMVGQAIYDGPVLAHHEVRPRESIRKLARLYYGDANRDVDIVKANLDLIDDPDEIFVGTVLRIPDLGLVRPGVVQAGSTAPVRAPTT
ncbi:MAG TPA: DUF2235 domain-containing protein [Allosphingosinicella sp.]